MTEALYSSDLEHFSLRLGFKSSALEKPSTCTVSLDIDDAKYLGFFEDSCIVTIKCLKKAPNDEFWVYLGSSKTKEETLDTHA